MPSSKICLWSLGAMLLAGSVQAAVLDPGLLEKAEAEGRQPVLLVFPASSVPLMQPLRPDLDAVKRRRYLMEHLQMQAHHEQADLRAWLDDRGIEYRAWWIANLISARLSAVEIRLLEDRPEPFRIALDAPLQAVLPESESMAEPKLAPTSLPWGLSRIRADEVWAAGIRGQGVVIAGADTGYDWQHPALKTQYRGWDGSQASHAYNWHDAVHESGGSCPANSPEPCDDHSHGTHTMGTMLGLESGFDPVGVAPEARWIGCRNMKSGAGTTSRYIECMQWFLAPTDAAGKSPDPAMAPDVINNSWVCIPSEGCTTGEELRAAVENLVAGGIVFVASAGNRGPGCSSLRDAPAMYTASFTVAASNSADQLADFSSRGPIADATAVTLDITAPGVGVRSSIPGGGYGNKNGTSMAGPHVAGVVALILSANPALRGQPHTVHEILRSSAVREGISDPYRSSCGGLSLQDWPNWQAGHGRLDAMAAVQRAMDWLFLDGFE